jgi:hypothetical protein
LAEALAACRAGDQDVFTALDKATFGQGKPHLESEAPIRAAVDLLQHGRVADSAALKVPPGNPFFEVPDFSIHHAADQDLWRWLLMHRKIGHGLICIGQVMELHGAKIGESKSGIHFLTMP